jgi:hypothetical protein
MTRFSLSLVCLCSAVKVDVEGSEWDVLHGMQELLSHQRIELMSFEYGVGWNKLFSENRKVDQNEGTGENSRTLRRFQTKMSSYGYDTYLIHGGTKETSNAVVLVPCSGAFWHDELELCFDRKRVYGDYSMHCWTDLLVVRRCNACLRQALHERVLPATGGRLKSGSRYRPFGLECPDRLL